MPQSPARIGIFLAGALGDFLLSLPALIKLRNVFPTAEIDLIGNPSWLPLARQWTLMDRVYSIEELPIHAGFQPALSKDHRLFRFLTKYHLIISWFGDKNGEWENTLNRVCPGEVHVMPLHQCHSFPGHMSDYYLSTLNRLDMETQKDSRAVNSDVNRDTARRPGIPPGLSFRSRSEKKASPFLCLHPGSGSNIKNWPKENYLQVALLAGGKWNIPVVVLLGPAENKQADFWKGAVQKGVSVISQRSILDVLDLMSGAAMYVGNDSGITHLAAVLGIPAVALFGPTDPSQWHPLGPYVKILQRELPCSPCNRHASPACQKNECLQQISPGEVLRALGELYSEFCRS